jgi:hypothetical protein
MPEGPEPMTATLLAVLGGHLRRGGELRLVAHEALELADGDGLALLAQRTHLPSHWFSCGHTRPQMAGSMECSRMTSRAPPKSSARIFSMNCGILMFTGQPVDALRLLAVQAAVGLGQRHLLRVALVDGTEVASALGGRLLVVRGTGCLRVRDVSGRLPVACAHRLLIGLEGLALLGTVCGLACAQVVPVDLRGIEVGAVDAGELRLAVDRRRGSTRTCRCRRS